MYYNYNLEEEEEKESDNNIDVEEVKIMAVNNKQPMVCDICEKTCLNIKERYDVTLKFTQKGNVNVNLITYNQTGCLQPKNICSFDCAQKFSQQKSKIAKKFFDGHDLVVEVCITGRPVC